MMFPCIIARCSKTAFPWHQNRYFLTAFHCGDIGTLLIDPCFISVPRHVPVNPRHIFLSLMGNSEAEHQRVHGQPCRLRSIGIWHGSAERMPDYTVTKSEAKMNNAKSRIPLNMCRSVHHAATRSRDWYEAEWRNRVTSRRFDSFHR
jgi:hypothetical protein